jgi:hypothetical protein
MNHELICSWLGLPADAWPPDHYRLLGLDPGESDLALIEQRVHSRLDAVRGYQMMHPEPATEAMNRLAQAFVCLTEPAAKKAYDQALLGERFPPPPVRMPAPSPQPQAGIPAMSSAAPAAVATLEAMGPRPIPAASLPRDPLVWLYTPGMNGPGGQTPPPPPVRLPTAPPLVVDAPAPPVERNTPPPPTVERTTPPPPPLPAAPPPPPIDTVVQSAQSSPRVQRGLATRRALYNRIARTRGLLHLWHRIGKHLLDADKRLSKQEASELYKLVNELEDTLGDFPLLGEAGQPGYLILNLTQLDKARALQGLSTSQRESLQRDWKSSLRFLEAHRDYLRRQLRAHRKRGLVERAIRAARAYINEQPLAAALLLLALAAVSVAVWKSFWPGHL